MRQAIIGLLAISAAGLSGTAAAQQPHQRETAEQTPAEQRQPVEGRTLASAADIKLPAGDLKTAGEVAPVKRRAARVTSCRCGAQEQRQAP